MRHRAKPRSRSGRSAPDRAGRGRRQGLTGREGPPAGPALAGPHSAESTDLSRARSMASMRGGGGPCSVGSGNRTCEVRRHPMGPAWKRGYPEIVGPDERKCATTRSWRHPRARIRESPPGSQIGAYRDLDTRYRDLDARRNHHHIRPCPASWGARWPRRAATNQVRRVWRCTPFAT